MPSDLQAELARVGDEYIRNALAIQLAVIQDINFFKSQALRPGRRGCALNIIRRERTEIINFSRWPIHRRLPGPKPLLSESWIGIGWRQLHEPRFVRDRHANFRGTAVIR